MNIVHKKDDDDVIDDIHNVYISQCETRKPINLEKLYEHIKIKKYLIYNILLKF